MKCRLAGFIVTMLLFSFTLSAQNNGGVVKGKVKDSSYNVVVSNATIAVYKKADSTLLQFCLPNNFGEFSLSNLPFNEPLRIQVTHVGYDKYENTFIIHAEKKTVDLGWIYLQQYASLGDEVIVTAAIAPVRMNGDTLEFNPRAFKMQTDATAEDLMRRLPGFTIWSDGTITFNGKEIKSLYVDGKPFLGGRDITLATQNLPKDALDKIQVYQQYNEQNPFDSTLMANLKMKHIKKMGYFGKLGAGVGTDNRYVTDAMLSGFNKKLQVSAVATANNTNKIAKDIDVLIRNNSFKGEGNNIDYQPDFNLAGLNKPVTGGIRFQYDFISDAENQLNESINADYFVNHNNTLINKSATTRTILTADSFMVRRTGNSTSIFSTHQRFNSKYSKSDRKKSYFISFDGGSDYKRTVNTGSEEQERTGLDVISNGNFNTENRELTKNGSLTAEFIKHSNWYNSSLKHNRIPTDFTLRYSFNIVSAEGSGRNQSAFTSFSTAGQPSVQAFDRLYGRRDSVSKTSAVFAQYPYLRQLIFGDKRLGNIDLKLGGNFIFQHNDYVNTVEDVDTLSKNYLLNNYLTNTRQQNTTDLQPEVIVSKQFKQNLTNRYSRYFLLEGIARGQYYTNRHDATQVVQNFNYHYERFIPQFAATYNNHRFGKREIKFGIKYQTRVNYPTVQQISPLVDSTNLWVIPRDNANIRPEYTNSYSAFYLFESRKSKNPYSIGLSFDYNRTADKMTDSSLYDEAGRMQVFTINTNGYHYWHTGALVKKAYSPNKYQTFEFAAQYDLNRHVVPQYIDQVSNISKSRAHNIDGQLGYTYRHIVNLKLQQGIYYYDQELYGSNNTGFNSRVYYTRVGGSALFFNQLLCSSNITYRNSAAQSQAAITYTIWNASVAYRFLKSNQAEIKLSALDLLRQNKGVINTSERNVQTFGSNNVMQQYFLLSFAYYPRKFNK